MTTDGMMVVICSGRRIFLSQFVLGGDFPIFGLMPYSGKSFSC